MWKMFRESSDQWQRHGVRVGNLVCFHPVKLWSDTAEAEARILHIFASCCNVEIE
jgi:hypothetical protein